MYTIGEQVCVPADAVRWPQYPRGFVGQIERLEKLPAFEGEVWAIVAVVVNGQPQEARLVPLPLDLPQPTRSVPGAGAQPAPTRPPVVVSDVTHGPPRGFRRYEVHRQPDQP